MQFSAEDQRRAGVRVLRPWLASARMVGLFYQIGVLAQSRPGAVETIEMFVARMATRSADASLSQERKRSAG